MEKGLQKGRAEGEAVGLAKGEMKAKIKMIHNLNHLGMPKEQIAIAAKLSCEEVEKILEETKLV